MAAPIPQNLAAAVAQGDLAVVDMLLERLQDRSDVNKRSADGMTPLGIAAFWGYADIVQRLLKSGADVNAQNNGTLWTPLHCAAFQGHGPVILKLLPYKPDITKKDMRGRTAVDFASAMDTIWPFFAALGCKRTPKSELIEMDILHRISRNDPANEYSSSSSPSYEMDNSRPNSSKDRNPNMDFAAVTGDVLAEATDNSLSYNRELSFTVWNN